MLLNELSKWLGLWDSVPEVEIDVIWACRADSVAKYSSRWEMRASLLTQLLYSVATVHGEAEILKPVHVEPVQAIMLSSRQKESARTPDQRNMME